MASHARQQYFADEESIQKQSREFSLVDEIKDKIDSIEYWAQVNVIEEVQENWVPLEIVNKTVNVSVPEVIDNLYTIDPSNSLSAKQWKILYDLIQNLQSRGRYISNWNAATWLPITNPPESPYEYKAWDYYIVSNVASLGGTNYRPEPIEFVIWQASTTIEPETVKVTDMYLYDGTTWNLLINSTREIAIDSSLSASSTNPVENRVVTNAINGKQDTLVAWSNIQIASDWKTISATDTTYTAGTNVSIDANNEISAVDTTYTAWANVQISNENVISATDTTYAAWDNIAITNNTISATYTAWTGIDITNWVISNTQTSAEWWNITGTLSDQTDLQDALDDKQDILTAWDGIDIDANDEISVDVTDIIGTWLSEDASNNIIIDTTVVATQTDLSWKQDKATSGSTAPSTTPSYVWQQYIDTTNDKMYVATGTSSSSDWTEVGAWSWDMLYSDFNWVTKTWATITLDLRSEITPSTDFTVNKPSTLEDWQYYILRVTSWATAYTMTLWTNVTNPYSEDLTLEASTIQQFTFLAKGWNLELQPSSEWVVYTAWTWITISNDEISVDVTDIIGTWLSEDANNNIIVDSTVVALKSDLTNYYTKTETYTKTEVDNLISSFWSFEVVDTLPSVSTASEKTIYLLGPIWTGADKYEEWIVTEDSQQQKQWTKIWETSVDLSDLNTKTFYLSSTSDLTTATSALQWHFAGKNAIIVYRWNAYTIWTSSSSSPLVFVSTIAISRSSSSPITENWVKNLQIFFDSSHNATVIHDSNKYNSQSFLETGYNYTIPYTPEYAGSPATKKYVDDNIVQKSATAPSSPTEWMVWYDTTNDILKAYDWTQWNVVWNWDMAYADFNWVTKTWATITLDFNSVIEPSANFTVNAPSTIKDWQIYILRVESGATAYTMTLGTWITNPYSESTTLTANKIKLFTFLAIDGDLELQPSVQWGWIISSNNTYEDIIHLSQAEYDALVTKDPNTLYSTPEQWEWSWYLVQSEQQSWDKIIAAWSDILQPRLVYLTRTEYENLPSSKLTDWIDYVIIKE